MTEIDIEVDTGIVVPIPVLPTSTDVTLARGRMKLCGWSLRESSGELAVQAEGSVVSPGANAVITLMASMPNGTYDVTWSVALQGAAAAADANNFRLFANNAAVVGSINAGAAGAYPQVSARVVITTGIGISVNTIGAGTVGVTYLAQFEAVPVLAPDATAEIQDAGNILGEVAIPANGVHSQWYSHEGIHVQNQIKLHMITGAVTGCVFVRYGWP